MTLCIDMHCVARKILRLSCISGRDLTITNVRFWSASYSAYLVFTKTIILLRFGLKVDI